MSESTRYKITFQSDKSTLDFISDRPIEVYLVKRKGPEELFTTYFILSRTPTYSERCVYGKEKSRDKNLPSVKQL